jgi:hypothetical protein
MLRTTQLVDAFSEELYGRKDAGLWGSFTALYEGFERVKGRVRAVVGSGVEMDSARGRKSEEARRS